MADAFPDHANVALRERIDNLFYDLDYDYSIPADEWYGGNEDEYDNEDEKPLMYLEREILGRDIFNGLEIIATDQLALIELASGKWIIERHVCLETENDNEEIEDYFSINMYSGEIYYDDMSKHDIAQHEFEKRLRMVEDI